MRLSFYWQRRDDLSVKTLVAEAECETVAECRRWFVDVAERTRPEDWQNWLACIETEESADAPTIVGPRPLSGSDQAAVG